MTKLFIVDASGYIYRAYHAIRNMTNAKGESTNALFGFVRSLANLIKDFNADHLVAVFDGPRSIEARKAIFADYKATRSETPKDLPYQIDWARQYCQLKGIPMLNIPGVEADDTIGSVALFAAEVGYEVYICSSDKDLCQLVGEKIFMLNTFKENLILDAAKVEEIYGVPPERIVDWLALTGDSSDNVPGVTGFGPKTASTLLKEYGSLDQLLAQAAQLPGKKGETLVAEASMARLSRQLVTLHTVDDFPKQDSFFQLGTPDVAALKQFYIQMGFSSLLKEMGEATALPATVSAPSSSYQLVDTPEALLQLVQDLQQQTEVCFDTETTALHPQRAELVGIGFCWQEGRGYYVPANGQLGREAVLAALKPVFESKKIGFFGHNIKYDLHVIANYGIKLGKISFDTMIASYLLNANSRQHSLDALSLHYFDKVKISIDQLIGKGKKVISMAEVAMASVCTYCCEDADYTYRLKQLLDKELRARGLDKLFNELELPLLSVLFGMERRGIFVDVDALAQMGKEMQAESARLTEAIYTLAGAPFNINSPRQIGDILFVQLGLRAPKRTKTGEYSTGAEVLEGLQQAHPIIPLILEYRTLEKLRTGYVEALPHDVLPQTHRIHCSFNQTVAATGRLSCQDPNLQNIPIRSPIGKAIREVFRPEKKGWSYLAADYSQIELRLLAHLSCDPVLIEAFNRQEDIHTFTAALVFGIPKEQVSKEQRHQAKAVNFGVIYGQQAFGLSQELGISTKAAADFIQKYFDRYKRVHEWVEECKEKARKTGKAVTLNDRERAIPEIHSKNGLLRQAAERLAVNTPLQGLSADIIKKAMIHIDKRLKKEQKLGYIVLQIHDELLFEAPDFELIDLQAIVKQEMEGVIQLNVPLVVDISIGKNWKEC